MYFSDRLNALREEAEGLSAADQMFDGKETEEVAEELADIMESIPEEGVEETTNGGVPFTAEMCSMVKTESASVFGRRKPSYMLEHAILRHYMESNDIEDPAEAVEDIAAANSGSEDDDGVEVEITKADVVVVAPSDEEVKELIDDAVTEAKISGGKKGPARKKIDQLKKSIVDLRDNGIRVGKKKSKK